MFLLRIHAHPFLGFKSQLRDKKNHAFEPVLRSVPDPDPNPDSDPPDPHVFGPPGSFCHQAKLVRKTLILTVFFFTSFGLFIFENDVNVPSKNTGNNRKTLLKN